jgi:hypothetical protein
MGPFLTLMSKTTRERERGKSPTEVSLAIYLLPTKTFAILQKICKQKTTTTKKLDTLTSKIAITEKVTSRITMKDPISTDGHPPPLASSALLLDNQNVPTIHTTTTTTQMNHDDDDGETLSSAHTSVVDSNSHDSRFYNYESTMLTVAVHPGAVRVYQSVGTEVCLSKGRLMGRQGTNDDTSISISITPDEEISVHAILVDEIDTRRVEELTETVVSTVTKTAFGDCDAEGDKGLYTIGLYTGVVLRSTGMPHGVGRMLYKHGRIYEGDWYVFFFYSVCCVIVKLVSACRFVFSDVSSSHLSMRLVLTDCLDCLWWFVLVGRSLFWVRIWQHPTTLLSGRTHTRLGFCFFMYTHHYILLCFCVSHRHNGYWNGDGYTRYSNGDCYKGGYKLNQRHGLGTFITNASLVYEGMFRHDKSNGRVRELALLSFLVQ